MELVWLIPALPVAGLRDHLRLGTGFETAGDAAETAALAGFLRAAMATIEARTGKALIARSYVWTLTAWRDLAAQVLPVAPVTAITALTIVDRLGAEETVDPARYVLEPDLHRPRLVSTGYTLPVIPVGGTAVIAFDAGLGATWAEVPADIAQAVKMLAAHYYENRGTAPGWQPCWTRPTS